MRLRHLGLCSALLFACGSSPHLYAADPAVKGAFQKLPDFATVRKTFDAAPQEYAPHAFWFWNAPLNEAHSTAMAREMSRQGLNPGYIHPRHLGLGEGEGLPVDQWLSPQYFDCLRGVLEECLKAGTFLGFSDEYWWPSGRIGGRMVTAHPEMQAKELTWEKWTKRGQYTVYLPPAEFVVAARESSPGVIDTATLQVLATGTPRQWVVPAGEEWSIYIFRKIATVSRDRGPDETLVNYMEPKLAEYTIEMGLKPYADNLKKYLGGPLRYAFSDNEGEYGNRLPWSEYLVTFYREHYGEDVRKFMPLLLTEDNGGQWVTARYRWFDMVSEMYANHFWKPMNDWLAAHGLYYVSNFWEADLQLQAATVGDYFRVNRAFSMPGNDALQMNASDPLQFKEIQSICEFEQRPFMSEIMGVQGWKQLPTEMKQAANWAIAWGVTHMVPHGISLDQDLTENLHPADWFDQNPYWATMDRWTSFCRRASFVNRQGRLATDVLIYNPMTSVWSLSENFLANRSPGRAGWANPLVKAIDQSYYGIQEKLTARNVEYLIADDLYLKDATVNAPDHALELRGLKFKTLILPPLFTVQAAVYKRIVDFAAGGGRVLLLGQLPVSSAEHGMNDAGILRLNERLRACPSVTVVTAASPEPAQICAAAAALIARPFEFQSGVFPVSSTHRLIGGNDFYWLANNTGEKQSATFLLHAGRGAAEKWDCESGQVTPLGYAAAGNDLALPLEFGPYEGFWVVFDAQRAATSPATRVVAREIPLPPDGWRVGVEGGQVAVTVAHVFVEGATPVATPAAIPPAEWRTQSILGPLNLLGQWKAQWLATPVKLAHAYLFTEFQLEAEPAQGFLSITADGGFTLFVNGQPVPRQPHATDWKQPDCVDLRPYLRSGTNRIAVASDKFIAAGDYWLLAQGAVQLANGKTVTIASGPDWQASENVRENWHQPGAATGGFVPATARGWNQLSWIRKGETHPPVQRALADNEIVWLAFDVPPGATSFAPGVALAQGEIWLDGTKQTAPATDVPLALPGGTKQIALRTLRARLNAWTKPGVFTCSGAAARPLANWDQWGLARFSGFLDYEQTFTATLASGQRATLDLGKLEYVAEIWLNGKKAGARMWPPFELDVTDFLVAGENHLKVRVGNLITNRMAVADDQNQLYRWGNSRIPGARYFQAGLEGPVSLRVTEPSR